MSVITEGKTFIIHTALGSMLVKTAQVAEYDVDDIIKQRAVSQARSIQFLNLARAINPNAPSGARTIQSSFIGTREELPE